MIKLVVADMDGTILQPDLSMSPRTIRAIHALQERGVLFAFATGRPDQLMKEYVDTIGLKGPIISSNGSVIGNPFQDDRVMEIGVDNEAVQQAITYLEAHNIVYLIYTKSGILCKANDRSRFFEARNRTLAPHQRSLFLYDDHPATLLTDQVVNKILIVEKDPTIYQTTLQWMKQLNQVSIIQSQSQFIDINPVGVNKGKALRQLAEYYTIQVDEVVAFGDHYNDVEMMKVAGIGVAMGNAVDEVKQAADQITSANDEDGVAHWIEEHLLQ